MKKRLFTVNKPCIIEAKYYDLNSQYSPSPKMSDIALKELIDHKFITEFIPTKFDAKKAKNKICYCLDNSIASIRFILQIEDESDVNKDMARTMLNLIKNNLMEVRHIVEEQL